MKTLTQLIPWSFTFLPRRRTAAQLSEAASPITPSDRQDRPVSLATDKAAALTERRAAALRAMFPLLFSRYARRADLWHAVVVERYLSQAANLTDLEQRINEAQQRRQFSWSE